MQIDNTVAMNPKQVLDKLLKDKPTFETLIQGFLESFAKINTNFLNEIQSLATTYRDIALALGFSAVYGIRINALHDVGDTSLDALMVLGSSDDAKHVLGKLRANILNKE